MKEEVICERIRRFLILQFPTIKNVGNDESLLKNGFIDSLGILEVVAFLENEFRIAVSDEDLCRKISVPFRVLATLFKRKRVAM